MAMRCKLCGKGPSFGNVISHANNTRRRRWNQTCNVFAR